FVFSSRGGHTRCARDWSSDVCSSDLPAVTARGDRGTGGTGAQLTRGDGRGGRGAAPRRRSARHPPGTDTPRRCGGGRDVTVHPHRTLGPVASGDRHAAVVVRAPSGAEGTAGAGGSQ